MPPLRRARAIPAALLASALIVAPAHAQPAPATRTLARPAAEFAEPFSAVVGVRELRDGRVVVADRLERSVQLLDLGRGTARLVGREGGGPNEYAMPAQLLAMPGDSTLLFDTGNMRFLVIDPAGAVVRTFSTMDPNEPDMRLLMPRASDEAGHLYFLDRGLRGPGAGVGPAGRAAASPDSGTVLRYDPRTKAVAPLGRVALPASQTTSSGSGGQQRVMMMNIPFAAQDDWTVGRDGRLAVVRHDPYRVEWVAPNGQRVVGPELDHTPIRVTDRDRERLRSSRATVQATALRVTVGGPGGQGGTSVSTAPPPATIRPPEPTTWPDFKPPFTANAAAIGPDGRLWVLRSRAADDEVPAYDLFDGYGRLAETVKLPAGTRLVGFGRTSAYLVRVDEDDLQYVQRYELF